MRSKVFIALSMAAALFFQACGRTGADSPDADRQEPAVPGEGDYAAGAPIIVRDGKVRFYIEMAEGGASSYFHAGDDAGAFAITVGNRTYPVECVDGYVFADVEQTATGSYNAVLTTEASSDWAGVSKYTGLVIPFSQFSHKTRETAMSLPRYAEYRQETGNRLIFGYSAALVNVRLKGNADIASLKLEASDGETLLAGTGYFAPSMAEFGVEGGKRFVVLNATESGAFSPVNGSSATEFPIFIAPGDYPGGLELTICDSRHLMMKTHLDISHLAPDEVITCDISYAPDDDLLFYDGFDTFVWGGDIMSGNGSYGCRPDAEETGTSMGTSLTGYEQALTQVSYSTPGTGFIQPDVWSSVSGKTVADARQMSASYVTSRNIGDYELLFRVQEYPGYAGIGTANEYGGMFKAPLTRLIGGNEDITISFDYCPSAAFADNLLLKIDNGGRIRSLHIDGKQIAPESGKSGYLKSSYSFALAEDAVEIPASAAASKTWHHLEAYLENANTSTAVVLTTSNNGATSGNGFYLDNFEVRKAAEVKNGDLRVLYWNIQDGMWADQHNNYDNFVAWVKSYNPDVCVWCEAETVYKDKVLTTMPKADRYLPDGWSELARRYGHAYVSVSGDRDSYPQVITSRYPIETLRQVTNTEISGKPIVHGAGLFQVNAGGRAVNFISAHLWPQAYGYGVATADRPASAAANGGDLYRQFEMNWICTNLHNAPEYSSQQDWLMLGDMNSYSRLDKHFYNLAEDDAVFLCQDEIQDGTDLIDVIGTRYHGEFYSSVLGDAKRVDMAYASPSMYSALSNVQILIDDWCRPQLCTYVSGYVGLPSDHKPILMDFNFKY